MGNPVHFKSGDTQTDLRYNISIKILNYFCIVFIGISSSLSEILRYSMLCWSHICESTQYNERFLE